MTSLKDSEYLLRVLRADDKINSLIKKIDAEIERRKDQPERLKRSDAEKQNESPISADIEKQSE